MNQNNKYFIFSFSLISLLIYSPILLAEKSPFDKYETDVEMVCIYQGAQTVDLTFSLSDDGLYIDGSKVGDVESRRLTSTLTKKENKNVYLYEAVELGFEYNVYINFDEVNSVWEVEGDRLRGRCRLI